MKPKENNKKVIWTIIIIAMLSAVMVWFFQNQKSDITGLKKGYITIGEDSSDLVDSLFYYNDKGVAYINLSRLDGCVTADVIKSQGIYIISTIKNQVSIVPNDDYYYVNSNKIADDSTYNIPISINGYIYADCSRIFKSLGYDSNYKFNYDNTTVELTLSESEQFNNNMYSQIKTTILNNKIVETTQEQIEDKMEIPETEKEAENVLPVVPEPTAVDRENLEIPDQNFIPDEEVKETDLPEPELSVPTEEEFKENRWKTKKEELTEIFQTSTPNYGQNAFAELGENGICYNQASKGIYGNTVTVLKDTTDGYYMQVSLAADWSDQALNVVSEQSKAFYQGVEEVYRKTLVSVLGETEGTAFFTYLKEHADQTTQGGYISQYDEKGLITAVWTDGPVGDGLQASTLELAPWINRYTDDGLRYDIVRNGDGIIIIVF